MINLKEVMNFLGGKEGYMEGFRGQKLLIYIII